ncbi:unnamed protein product [Scytosiphon promiscuus]
MRWLCLFLQVLSLSAVAGDRVLLWEDNFDGDSLDETVWIVKTGNGCDQGYGLCGWGNSEQQTYTEDNHQVRDGALWITARTVEEEVDERWYTSSRIRSSPPVAFLTGRIEARIQLPAGLGLWAAFWMLPSNSSARGNWAATGEIDIMEAVNDMDTILGTIHYGGEYPANRHAGCKSGQLGSGLDYSDDYHVYAIEWEQEEMRWYVDDQLFCQRTKWTSDLESFEPYRAPFDTEFEILLNLAVGGSLPGRHVDDSIFPATMLVDYVRVYDMSTDVPEAEPFLGLAACLPGTIQAEAFDTGGLGLGFGEFQKEGEAGTYRVDGVGLVLSESGRTYVADLIDTDWLAYTIMTEEAVYDITFEVSAPNVAVLQLVIGDNATCANPGEGSIMENVTVGATGGDGFWGTTAVAGTAIPAGTHSLKLCVSGGAGISVDSMQFELVEGSAASTLTAAQCATSGQSRPYMNGEPWVIPGYMEAEYYDYGGLGVSYHKIESAVFGGDSTLRLPDAVGVIEAQSNPSNGHYVGHWYSGEWLAFTARAEEAAFWHVGASIASGLNGTSVEFRMLVNATNCSTVDTDGMNGLGDEGVDLLNGPLSLGYTGSWEAFEEVYKEEVFVPLGTHRFLFCADDGVFNLNFLRVWTPAPTPAPTMAPTIAPTAAPTVVSDDDGLGTRWIYIGVASALVLLAFSRLGCIVYKKESARRRHKPDSLEPAYIASKGGGSGGGSGGDPDDHGENGFLSGVTPPTEDPSEVRERGFLSCREKAAPSDGLQGATTGAGIAAVAAAMTPGGGIKDLGSPSVKQRNNYRDLFGGQRQVSRRLSSSVQEEYENDTPTNANTKANALSQVERTFSSGAGAASSSSFSLSSAKHTTSSYSKTAPPAAFLTPGRTRSRPSVSRSSSAIQPMVSPVSQPVGAGPLALGLAASTHALQTPRAKSGMEVEVSGSLWDRSTTSPITAGLGVAALPPAPAPAPAPAPSPSPPKEAVETRLLSHNYKKKKKNGNSGSSGSSSSNNNNNTINGGGSSSNKGNGSNNGMGMKIELPRKWDGGGGRDQFEDALIRALDEKWENGRGATNGAGTGLGIARSNSISEGTTAMLRAVKTWTCVCQFENSVGQTSCLGCGRVAPLSRPTTPARRRLPRHRMNSNIPPPSEYDF